MLHYDGILVHFRRNWLHYDEQVFPATEMFALVLDYRALCRIIEIDCTIAELRVIFESRLKKGVYTFFRPI